MCKFRRIILIIRHLALLELFRCHSGFGPPGPNPLTGFNGDPNLVGGGGGPNPLEHRQKTDLRLRFSAEFLESAAQT